MSTNQSGTMPVPRVNGARLEQDLRDLAQIGATADGGVERLTLSEADRQGRDWFCGRLRDAGLAVRFDDLGNITGRRAGRNDEPALLIGSHLDTVRQGGRYDGAVGVLAALEVVRTLDELGVETHCPVEVVNWTNEEGVRFEPALLASGVYAGRFTRDYAYARTDRDGAVFGEELAAIGYRGEESDRPGPAAGYLELHIEQGPVLEDRGCPVGVVEGIVGLSWFDVVIKGRADHAGPSPMRLRRDAVVAAARVVLAVEELGRATGEPAVATVGRLNVQPNSINTIPGRVAMSIDVRHPEMSGLEQMAQACEEILAGVSAETGTAITFERFWTIPPTPFDRTLVTAVAAATVALDLPVVRCWSGAAHDAKYLAEVCPTAMVFVRSQDGLSHNEAEYCSPEDIEAGANVLLGTVLALTR